MTGTAKGLSSRKARRRLSGTQGFKRVARSPGSRLYSPHAASGRDDRPLIAQAAFLAATFLAAAGAAQTKLASLLGSPSPL